MRWLLIWQMVKREISRHLSFSAFFILNLSLGLVGLIMINSLQDSINIYLEGNLRNNLGGDIAIRTSDPIDEEKLKLIKNKRIELSTESEKVSYFSMLNYSDGNRLVNIIAIDDQFPLYGDLSLLSGQSLASAFVDKTEGDVATIWMLPNNRQSLGLEIGEIVSIADTKYRVGEDVSPDSSAIGLNFSLAPIVYIQVNHLNYSYFNARGSRVSYSRIYKLKQQDNTQLVAQQMRDDLNELFAEGTVPRVQTYLNANRQVSNILTLASSYFSMFALIALFLSGIGAIYLYRGSLIQRFMQMAIMNSLGVKKKEIYSIYVLHSFLLGLFATLTALLICVILLPIFNQFLTAFNIANLSLHLTLKSVILASLTGILGSLAFCYPAIQQISQVNTQSLLKFGSDIENKQEGSNRDWKKLLPYVSVLLFIFLVSIYQTSLASGIVFLLTFVSGLITIGIIAMLLIKLCKRLSQGGGVHSKIALRNIVRHRWGSIVTFSVLGLGAFLLNIVPQIYQGLQNEIDTSDRFNVPSLFLFDIQPEQIQPLKELIAHQDQNLVSVTPMIRGRLKQIDGKTPTQKRFAEDSQALTRREAGNRENPNLSRGVRITYRAQLSDSESIFKGQPLVPQYDGDGGKDDPIQVSIETRFAQRFGIKLGSSLEFDVQGIPVYGEVVNIRKVKWNSFSPNFYIVLQPGLLEAAPQTYLATIGKTSIEKRITLQTEITKKFSNISIVDVTDLVTQIANISGKITLAVTVIAIFAILVGFMVIYSISYGEAKQKSNEMNLFKVLGGKKRSIYSIFVLEFGLVSVFASSLGIIMSIIATIAFSTYLFENIWSLDFTMVGLSFVLMNLFTVSLTLISARNTLNQRAQLEL